MAGGEADDLGGHVTEARHLAETYQWREIARGRGNPTVTVRRVRILSLVLCGAR